MESKYFHTQIRNTTYDEVCKRWGGEPDWDIFKSAARNGAVSTNWACAMNAIGHPYSSQKKVFFFVVILPLAWWFSVPLTIGLFLIFDVVGMWIIAGGVLFSWIAKKAAYAGVRKIIIDLAKIEEDFYYCALRRGAFDF